MPSKQITDRLDHVRSLLAKYRAEAIALHARLVALELAGNDNVAPLRRALIESSVQIESIGRLLDQRDKRLARGTEEIEQLDKVEQIDEWVDLPTLRR